MIVKRLEQTFLKDWDNSERIDLSDEGIRKNLEEHGLRDKGSLALNVSAHQKGGRGHRRK